MGAEFRKKRILVFMGVWLMSLIAAASILNNAGRTDVMLVDYKALPEGGMLIKAGVSGSAGYIRSMKIKEADGDAMVDFYSTFGINNPQGAKNEFLLEVSDDCQRILFRGGDNHYRIVLQREGNEWIRQDG